MFESFFPRPKLFFISLLIWASIVVLFWFTLGTDVGEFLGFQFAEEGASPVIGMGFFVTPNFLWFYLYYIMATIPFWLFWQRLSPNKWHRWSILGSALILFSTYYGVQVSVAINHWRRPFGDTLQNALMGEGNVTMGDFYGLMGTFAEIAFIAVAIFTFTRFL